MRSYVNCWKVTELSDWDLQTIKDLGFVGIRFDIQNSSEVEPSCERLIEFGLEGIMLLNGGKMPLTEAETTTLADRCASLAAGVIAIEVGNEPDISPTYEKDWDAFGRLVNASALAVAGRWPVISGGVYSTSRNGQEYLGYALRWMDPSVIVGVHSYRQTGSPGKPSKGFGSRDDEFQSLKRVAGYRPTWCTETGWHTAEFPYGLFGWQKKRWKDDEVLAWLVAELRMQSVNGTITTVVYQWTDGPTDEGIDRFGLKTYAENVLKPQAMCVKQAFHLTTSSQVVLGS